MSLTISYICNWIDKAHQEGGQGLVCCRVGVSRSATVIVSTYYFLSYSLCFLFCKDLTFLFFKDCICDETSWIASSRCLSYCTFMKTVSAHPTEHAAVIHLWMGDQVGKRMREWE